jgi:hypothetical protein
MNKTRHMLNKLLTSPGWVLLFVVLFSVAYFVFAHEGFYWIDDYGYAKYAWQLTKGTFSVTPTIHPSNPLTHRFMVFGPVAIFYLLFGINIYSTTLWPLLCTVGCSGIIWLLLRKEKPTVSVLAMLLLGLYFHSLFLASYLYPDNILMFFALGAVAILYRFRYQIYGRNPVLYAALFVLFNFLAFLTKETIIYYLPFYFFLFLLDIFSGKKLSFWFWSAGLGLVVLGVYFGYYHFRTGDAFFRFHIIEKTNIAYHAGEPENTKNQLWERLTYGPLFFFIGSGIMVPFIFALGLFTNPKRLNFKLLSPEIFWLLLALLVTAMFWFGSTSLQFYTPITLLPRMVTLLLPPLCIAGALGLENLLAGSRKAATFYTLAFVGVCLADRSNTLLMYLPLALFFSYCWGLLILKKKLPSLGLTVLVLIAALSLRPLHFMRKPSLMSFREQEKIIEKYLNKQEGKYLVLSDPWLSRTFDFAYDFELNPHYTYHPFNTVVPDLKNYTEVYLLINQSNLSNPDMAKLQTVQKPELQQLYPQRELVAKEGEVYLYKIPK